MENQEDHKSKESRRSFLKKSFAGAAGLMILPSHVISGLGYRAPSDKLNIAGVGIGGMGNANLSNIPDTENIVALCDVDWNDQVGKVFKKYPGAKRYKDYRVMLDKQKDIDGVIIATPDHTHAVITMEAIKRNKGVFTQKPLTHSVWEARVLTKAAKRQMVATQMGNQGQAGDGPRRLREMIWDDVIGPVREVHVWTDRPIWPQGLDRPEESPSVPDSLDWDLFIGPAPMRPYHPAYHPFKWRGWWDFGTGALGDIACHSFDPIFRALKLQYPTNVESVSSPVNKETFPLASKVYYEFPARKGLYDMPPVSLTWYDGGLRPSRIPEMEDGEEMPTNGTLYVGDKGKILNDVIYPKSLRESYEPPEPYIPSSPGHEEEWIRACKGGDPAGSNFDWAGPLTETVLLGNIALRKAMKDKIARQPLRFDPEKFYFPNLKEANQYLHTDYREGWSL